MAKILNAADAKTHFADALRRAEAGEIVEISRYGRLVAALVGAAQLEQLRRLRAAGPAAGLAGLVGRFSDGEELATELDRVIEQRAGSKRLPDLEG